VCRREIEEFGVICYLRDLHIALYSWIHITCIQELVNKKVQEDLCGQAYYFVNIWREGIGCSVCGKTTCKKQMIRLGRFLVHPDCIEDLIKMTRDAMDKHGKRIAVTLI